MPSSLRTGKKHFTPFAVRACSTVTTTGLSTGAVRCGHSRSSWCGRKRARSIPAHFLRKYCLVSGALRRPVSTTPFRRSRIGFWICSASIPREILSRRDSSAKRIPAGKDLDRSLSHSMRAFSIAKISPSTWTAPSLRAPRSSSGWRGTSSPKRRGAAHHRLQMTPAPNPHRFVTC